jgi:hypothetical protein
MILVTAYIDGEIGKWVMSLFTRPQTGQPQIPCPTAKEAKSGAGLKVSELVQRPCSPGPVSSPFRPRHVYQDLLSEPGAEWLCSGPLLECEGTCCTEFCLLRTGCLGIQFHNVWTWIIPRIQVEIE